MSSFVIFGLGFICGFCFSALSFILKSVSNKDVLGRDLNIEIKNGKSYYCGVVKLSEIKKDK